MKRQQLQSAVDSFKQRQPFQPFVVELDEGERLIVDDPKQLPGFGGAYTYLRPGGNFVFVDPEDVARVVDLASANATSP